MARVAIWKSIAKSLSDDMAAGHYSPGQKLPTEAELAARFGVNRHTVRRGLADLAARGLVHARRGAGVFVTLTPTDYPLGRRVRFHQNILASGRTPSRHLTRLETRAADAREAGKLGIETGALVHVVEGLSLADGAPLAVFRSVFPAARFPGLLAAMAQTNSVTAALAAEGLADYTRAETQITAIAAEALLALQLQMSEGAPVIRSVAVNVDGAAVPVEYGITWFAGERVALTVAAESLS